MKIILLLLLPITSFCQFHVSVEANPDNDGLVNSEWMNNYVVMVTNDNWQTKLIVSGKAVYVEFDGKNPTVSFQPCTFQYKEEAIDYARRFIDINYYIKFTLNQAKDFARWKVIYDAEQKKRPKRKESISVKQDPVVIR